MNAIRTGLTAAVLTLVAAATGCAPAADTGRAPMSTPIATTAGGSGIPTEPPDATLPAGTPTAPPPANSPTAPVAAIPAVVPAEPAASPAPTARVAADLRRGSTGADIVALQERLNQLGFWIGPADGNFGDQTRQGVIAAQKAAGIPTDGIVGPITADALARGVTLRPRTTSGRALEVDKARQLLLVVADGRVERVYNTSTGGDYVYWNPGSGRYENAETPAGTFTVGRQVDGWDPGYLGAIYRPHYFNGGVAVHGTRHDVTDTPESHGCVRLAIPSMDEIIRAGQIAVGMTVVVY
ncbi:MAG: L,D-transpeptidase family protein [Propionibacteriaceae bacterium]|nr:L,D-transpeptidase family protein [Propionibacteriaceae bacterium]